MEMKTNTHTHVHLFIDVVKMCKGFQWLSSLYALFLSHYSNFIWKEKCSLRSDPDKGTVKQRP